jgi:hypothetical protein
MSESYKDVGMQLWAKRLNEIELRFLSRWRWDYVVEASFTDLFGSPEAMPANAAVAVCERLKADFWLQDFWVVWTDDATGEVRLTILLYHEGRYTREQVQDSWRQVTNSARAWVAEYADCRGLWHWLSELQDDVVDFGGSATELGNFAASEYVGWELPVAA